MRHKQGTIAAIISVMLMAVLPISAQVYRQMSNISYTSKTDAYAKERLKLDVYYPEGLKDCPVVVWLHGGGLEAGSKEIPSKLKEKGIVVVWRLVPRGCDQRREQPRDVRNSPTPPSLCCRAACS